MDIFKPNVDKLKLRKDYEALIKACEYEGDSSIRIRAIEALTSLHQDWPEQQTDDILLAIFLGCRDNYPSVRAQSIIALGMIGDLRGIGYVIKATNDPDRSVRLLAIEALGKYGNEKAREILLQRLSSTDGEILHQTIKELSKLKEQRAVQPILEIFDDVDGSTQRLILETLSYFDSAETRELLISLLKSDFNTRRYAVLALDRIGWVPETLSEKIDYYIAKGAWKKLTAIGSQALNPLIATFKYRDVSNEAIAKVIMSFGVEAIDQFIRATEDQDNFFRLNAFEALAQMGDVALERLILALQNEDFFIRNFAANALKAFGPRSVRLVIPQLKNPDAQIRLLVSQILEAHNWVPRSDIEKTYFLIAKGDWDELVKVGKSAVKHIIYALVTFDEKTNIIKTLVKIGDEKAIDTMVDLLDNKEYAYIARSALISFGDKAADKVIQALDESSTEFRVNAAVILGFIASNDSIEILRTLLYDPDMAVKATAVVALGSLVKKNNRTDILKDIIEMLEDDSPEIKKTVIDVLGKIHFEGTIDIIFKYIADEEVGISEVAESALFKFDRIKVIDYLTGYFRTKDEKLRRIVADMLKKLNYKPEKTNDILDYALFIGDAEAYEIISDDMTPLLVERVLDDDYYESAANALIYKAVPELISIYLDDEDTTLKGRIYQILSSIDYSYRKSNEMGDYFIANKENDMLNKTPWEELGDFLYLNMDCPMCKKRGIEKKALHAVAEKCAENGFASYKCSNCKKISRIPITIFTESLQTMLTDTPSIAVEETFKNMPLIDVLVWDWPQKIYNFNKTGRETIKKIKKQQEEFEKKYHEWIEKNAPNILREDGSVDDETAKPAISIKTSEVLEEEELVTSGKPDINQDYMPPSKLDKYKGTWRDPALRNGDVDLQILPDNLTIFDYDTQVSDTTPTTPWKIEEGKTLSLKAVLIISSSHLDSEKLEKILSNAINIWDFANYREAEGLIEIAQKEDDLKNIKKFYDTVKSGVVAEVSDFLTDYFKDENKILSMLDKSNNPAFKNLLLRISGGVALAVGVMQVKE